MQDKEDGRETDREKINIQALSTQSSFFQLLLLLRVLCAAPDPFAPMGLLLCLNTGEPSPKPVERVVAAIGGILRGGECA